jgi:hypothetical protein
VTQEEVDLVEPILSAASRRGIMTLVERNADAPADIGIYCHHMPNPRNSRFSIVTLHDVGQNYWPERMTNEANNWTDTADNENWSGFDIALLPGPSWSNAWLLYQDNPRARPRIGVFEVGWPKSDPIFDAESGFYDRVDAFKQQISLTSRPTVLFPAWETEEYKSTKHFLSAIGGLDVNILVKFNPMYAPPNWEIPNVTFLDSRSNIFECLAISDVVVSDESNCLAEGLLFGLPPVSLTDLVLPALPQYGIPERFPDPPPWGIQTDSAELKATIRDLLNGGDSLKQNMRAIRDQQFSCLGRSSNLILDIVESAMDGRDWPAKPVWLKS